MVFHRFKYPKFALLIISIVVAYFLFKNPVIQGFVLGLDDLNYLGMFIAGILFALGFTAPFAVGFFIVSNPENIILSAFVASIGALFTNLLIFNFIKFSFRDELKRLEKTYIIKEIEYLVDKEFDKRVRLYLLYVLAGILIASPLPDGIADTILGGFTKINPYMFAVFSFCFSFIGISLMLMI